MGGGGGGHKFKLSDLMPNSWFLKLKKIKKPMIMTQNLSKNPSPQPSSSSTTILASSNTFPSSSSSSTTSSSSSSLPAISLTQGRTAHYFKRDLIISSIQNSTSNTHVIKSPRKSTRRNRASSNNRVSLSSPRRRSVHGGAGCACHLSVEAHYPPDSTSNISTDRSVESNISKAPTSKDSSFIEIPPIVTKKVPKKLNDTRRARITPVKRVSVSSPRRVRVRTHSPRMMTRRYDINNPPRWRGKGRSLAVVKSSMNPQKDFKESMVEMILENDIKGGKDLEDLLACYLELNSDGYHELIIKVFKQIWFDLNLNNM